MFCPAGVQPQDRFPAQKLSPMARHAPGAPRHTSPKMLQGAGATNGVGICPGESKRACVNKRTALQRCRPFLPMELENSV